MRRPMARGFSLLELLLALALTSMAALALSQTLAQISSYESKLSTALKDLNQQGVPQMRLRNAVESAAAIRQSGGGLAGQASGAQFRFIPAFPSHGKLSLPMAAIRVQSSNNSWQLLFKVDQQLERTIFEGSGEARLRFLDNEGNWHSNWPASSLIGAAAGIDRYRLPSAIQLRVQNDGVLAEFVTFAVVGPTLNMPSLDGEI